MSRRTLIVVMLALLCGGSAAVGVSTFLNSRESQGPRQDMVQVVVATDAIPRYTKVTGDMLQLKAFPKNMIPEGAIHRLEDVLGRFTADRILKNDPVVEGRLLFKGGGMDAAIEKGMRLFTILTPNMSSSVAGFIRPGNKVDVFLTVTQGFGAASGGAQTSCLLQEIDVWAVDQFVDHPGNPKGEKRELGSVTLLVTPQQAVELSLAQNSGKLHLGLRNPYDTNVADTKPVTLRQLLGEKTEPKEEPKKVVGKEQGPVPPSLGTIRTIRGVNESSLNVPFPNTKNGILQANLPPDQ